MISRVLLIESGIRREEESNGSASSSETVGRANYSLCTQQLLSVDSLLLSESRNVRSLSSALKSIRGSGPVQILA